MAVDYSTSDIIKNNDVVEGIFSSNYTDNNDSRDAKLLKTIWRRTIFTRH
jgi:hypothetical protein